MAGAWCLPKSLSNAFLKAVTDGTLAPERLMGMTSAERRAEFAKILGDDNAKEVNAAFEAKLLLKDQQRGMVNWAKKVGGISETTRADIISTISKLDRVLDPADEQSFLEDLAAKKLGVGVSAQEAKEIFGLAQKAEALRAEISAAGGGDYRSGWTPENGTAYGNAKLALVSKINEMKPGGQSIPNALVNALNFPKSALTSVLHWSAPFVQGWGMISTKQWWSGLGQMFQYFASEEHYDNFEGYMIGHPDYALAKDGKLGLTHLGDKLTVREEAIQSSLLEDANQWVSERTGVPNLIRAWSRSFTGFLNYVRFNRFTQLLDAARAHGEDVSPGSKVVSDLASVVNNFTGRGALGEGDKYSSVGPVLNAFFFSPRKMVATVEMFNPVMYARLSPTARMAAVRQLSGSLIATGAVLTLAKVAGAQVNMDPRSSDFGKFIIAGEKFDMTGGNAAYLRLLARVATGQAMKENGTLSDTVNLRGHALPTRPGAIANYMLGKASPIASLLANYVFGQDAMGSAFNVTNSIRDEMMPIVIGSYIKDVGNNPQWAASSIPALSALLGVGMDSPEPPLSQSGRDVWGDPIPGVNQAFGTTPRNWTADPVSQEAKAVGLYLGFPPDKIRGQKLTDGQTDEYAKLSGRLAHSRLSEVIAQPGWQSMSAPMRAKIMKSVIQASRKAVASSIMIEAQGSKNDIIKQATGAKIAALQ